MEPAGALFFPTFCHADWVVDFNGFVPWIALDETDAFPVFKVNGGYYKKGHGFIRSGWLLKFEVLLLSPTTSFNFSIDKTGSP